MIEYNYLAEHLGYLGYENKLETVADEERAQTSRKLVLPITRLNSHFCTPKGGYFHRYLTRKPTIFGHYRCKHKAPTLCGPEKGNISVFIFMGKMCSPLQPPLFKSENIIIHTAQTNGSIFNSSADAGIEPRSNDVITSGCTTPSRPPSPP